MKYPVEPLLLSTGLSWSQIVHAGGISGRDYTRFRDEGLSDAVAERLSVLVGRHPFEVWPEMLDHRIAGCTVECAADGCSERFIPRNNRNLYCGKTCRRREKARRYRATEHGRRKNQEHRKAYYWANREYERRYQELRRERARVELEEAA